MKAYNYSLAEDYKQKIVIPYIGIEIDGWLSLFAILIGIATIVVVLGVPLSFLLGSNGFLMAGGFAIIVSLGSITYFQEINQETGKNHIQEFYYTNIKKYKYVYDCKGIKHYLITRRKGVVFINARR